MIECDNAFYIEHGFIWVKVKDAEMLTFCP
jgi:hypothetical protein